ncbi:MAG: hypothetical protein M1423_03310 [Acidobacteria bacterium]|jgi:hypothetical protein|nr:hypothetical protein [Acidobacteriota bacterium]
MRKALWILVSVIAVAVLLVLRRAKAQVKSSAAPTSTYVSAPPRFQVVTVHMSTDEEHSALLDTQTGCAWMIAVDTNNHNAPFFQFVPTDGTYTPFVLPQLKACDAALAAAR